MIQQGYQFNLAQGLLKYLQYLLIFDIIILDK